MKKFENYTFDLAWWKYFGGDKDNELKERITSQLSDLCENCRIKHVMLDGVKTVRITCKVDVEKIKEFDERCRTIEKRLEGLLEEAIKDFINQF